jgi:hypothetical protein
MMNFVNGMILLGLVLLFLFVVYKLFEKKDKDAKINKMRELDEKLRKSILGEN